MGHKELTTQQTAQLDQALATHGEVLDKIVAKSRENADWPGTAKHGEEVLGSAVAFEAYFDSECVALLLAIAANRLAQANVKVDGTSWSAG